MNQPLSIEIWLWLWETIDTYRLESPFDLFKGFNYLAEDVVNKFPVIHRWLLF